MRPPLRLLPASVPEDHRIALVGELDAESSGDRRTHAFRTTAGILPRAGTSGILALEVRSDDLQIELDIDGSLQRDGTLTVTSEVRLRHAGPAAPGVDAAAWDTETTAVAAGADGRISLRCSDDHGCTVSVTGSITHGPSEEDPERS